MKKLKREKKKDIEVEVEVTIIPKLTPYSEISLTQGDTLVIHIDNRIWDLNDAQNIYTVFRDNFPDNKIMIVFNGVKIEVVRENEIRKYD